MVTMFASRSKIVLGVATLLAVISSATVHPAAAKDPVSTALSVPVVGTATGTVTGALNGTATITRFVMSNGQLNAVGTLTGTITNAATGAVQSLATTFSVPIAPAAVTAACEILHLDLGPIDLNLLGLTIHTNEIVLAIAAVPGPGNLLGNLLCSVANLLNGGGALSGIANLLNQILAAL